MVEEKEIIDGGKTPQKVAKPPQQKIDISSLTFELRLPGNIVLDALNSLKMASERFKSSFDMLNKFVTEGIRSHMEEMAGKPESVETQEEPVDGATDSVENTTETETK